ncbi:MAG: NeuD/PglB/VioB family sugar acetyltransferase [Anaerolineaceae bacterium]|nr:NeuD/PglB/VioB family sugar acetyltransferase [Anaerolineaceae bacterium]
MEKRIVIYGAGGHAKTVISLLRLLDWEIAGIIDDGVEKGVRVSGVEVLGGAEFLPMLRSQGVENVVNAVGGIGNYLIRWQIFERLRQLDFRFPTLIHPTAFVEDTVTLADGIQVLAQSYISSESKVGFGTLINAGVIISHDGNIGRCVNLSPGAMLAGEVTVEDFAQIGMGATINLEVKIGTRARVGNSAVVKKDVPADGRVYAGTVWPPVSGKGRGIDSSPFYRKIA